MTRTMTTETRTKSLDRLVRLRMELEAVMLVRRPDFPGWARSWRAKRRWEKRWSDWASDTISDLVRALPREDNILSLTRPQAEGEGILRGRRVRKDSRRMTPEEVMDRLRIHVDTDALASGSVAAYLRMALATGEDVGQFTLDALGLNRTFAWAHPRNMAQAIYAVRGSKVVQIAYGTHLEELASIIIRATDPTRPLTIDEVTHEIRERWGNLQRWQAGRIARTETAAVWETTSYNVMRANGVTTLENLIATGPSIGFASEPVCPICVEIAANGPYLVENLTDIPPYHPNCRCTLIPYGDYLPPQDPWAGENRDDLRVFDV